MHSFHEFIEEHTAIYKEWLSNPYLGFLSVKDEQELIQLRDKLTQKGINVSSFQEPDLDNQLTSISVEPGKESARWLSSLPLAFKEFTNLTVPIDCITKEAA
jgi:hypothetical protein